MTIQRQETDAEFDAFLAGVDRALTAQFGPNHQDVLSRGRIVSQFEWGGIEQIPGGIARLKRIDPG